LIEGDKVQQWWLQQGQKQQLQAAQHNKGHVPRGGSDDNNNNKDSTHERRPAVLKRLKQALHTLESKNLPEDLGPHQPNASPGRFGSLWTKERRCWHNFADPALGGKASPSNDPVWRAIDKAKVSEITWPGAYDAKMKNATMDTTGKEVPENMCAVIEIRGDGFVTQQVRRMIATVVCMTNEWLPFEFTENATRSDICMETPLAPPGRLYFAGGRFHFMELEQGNKTSGLFQERTDPSYQWQGELQSRMIRDLGNESIRKEEQAWLDDLQTSVSPRIRDQLQSIAKEDQLRLERAAMNAVPHKQTNVMDNDDHIYQEAPSPYQKAVTNLREIVKQQQWPRTSKARSRVIRSVGATDNPLQKHAATFDGELFQSGSFTVLNKPMVDDNIQLPLGNQLFPDLAAAVFELEAELSKIPALEIADGAKRPEGIRPPSTHCAVNRNAEFVPHVDSGRGQGQSISMIVGLGDYTGGAVFVEGQAHDIRYRPLEFDGWKQRHWTESFEGERYSLVWFTPAGNEDNVYGAKDTTNGDSEEDREVQRLVKEHQKMLPTFPALRFREKSTDPLVIKEMFDTEKGCAYELKKCVWEEGKAQQAFTVEGHQCVLDVGAHIGAFSRFALAAGCKKVIAYEPEPSNLEILKYNLSPAKGNDVMEVEIHAAAVAHGEAGSRRLVHARNRNDGTVNTWRHALEEYSQYVDKSTKLPNKRQQGILKRSKVDVVPFFGGALVPGVDFVKLDCEGAEIDILLSDESKDAASWLDVTHLVFEWSFMKEKRVGVFRQAIDNLRQAGFQVTFDGKGAWWDDASDPSMMWPFHNDLVVFARRL